MKNKNRTNLNAYLFGNLVILVILLISLWNKKPVWDVNLRFPNLLLILVILNSVLIFKNLILTKTAPRAGKKVRSGKSGKSLNSLRAIIQKSDVIDESIYSKTLSHLQSLGECEATALLLPENNYFKLIASHGELPPAFSGSRFHLRDNVLSIKFPGNLGEEEIGKVETKTATINFKSTVTRLETSIFPLRLKENRTGLLLFIGQEGHTSPPLPYSSTALFIETLISLIESASGGGDLRYKDKSTGLLKFDCFADSFETEIERSERYQQELSLFSVKIKFCKGSSEDDKSQLQKAAAMALKQSLRRLDLMFCGKSDCEFLAILSETSAEVAEIVAQRVQKSFSRQLEKLNYKNKDKNQLFIGSATYPTNATHGLGLIEMSRDALTQAESSSKGFVGYNLTK